MAEQNNGGSLFTVSPPPNNEIENYFHDPSNSKEVPLDSEGRAWNRTHYRYDAKNLPTTTVSANGTLPVSFIGGQVVLTGAVTSITLPTATQLKTQIETVWGAGTSTSYPWAWVVRTEFDNQTAGVVNLVMGAGDTALPGAGISFPANSLSEVEFQIMNSSPTATAIRVAIIANSSSAAGSNVTLTDDGFNETIIVNGTGPNLVVKSFAAGTLQQDGGYLDNVGSSFVNRVAAGTLYLTLPDSGVRNAGDLVFQGVDDRTTIANALASGGAQVVILPPYKSWDLRGATALIVSAQSIIGGHGTGTTTDVLVNDNTAFDMRNAIMRGIRIIQDDGVAPTNYAVRMTNGRNKIVDCIFHRIGVQSSSTGNTIERNLFLPHRNYYSIHNNGANLMVKDNRFASYNSNQLDRPNLYRWGTDADSGEFFVPSWVYSQGAIVYTNSYDVYVLVTAGGATSSEPTGYSNNESGGNGNVWAYICRYGASFIYNDPSGDAPPDFADIQGNNFFAGYSAFAGDLASFPNFLGNQCSTMQAPIINRREIFDPSVTYFPTDHLKIVSNTFYNTYVGVELYYAAAYNVMDPVIADNTFDSINIYSIALRNFGAGPATSRGLTVSGNNITNAGASTSSFGAIEVDSASSTIYATDFVINGNTIRCSTSAYGIYVSGGGAGAEAITNLIISDNMVLGATTDNIELNLYTPTPNQIVVEDNVAP